MNKPAVIVTGANGFIGGELVRHFLARGWQVRALVRTAPELRAEGADYLHYEISERPLDDAFKGARFLVHCAYVRHDQSADSDRINVEGARMLLECCRRWDVKPLFLSSFSAHDGAKSHYGRNKLEIEGMFDPSRDLILGPALVIGKGGLFGTMSKVISSRRFIPLVGSGNQLLQTIAIGDLCMGIEKGLEAGICGNYRLAYPTPVTLRAIYEGIASQAGTTNHLIPVPAPLLLFVCRLAEFLHVRLPVSSDSVIGLTHVRVIDTTRDLSVFGIEPKTFAESLATMFPPAWYSAPLRFAMERCGRTMHDHPKNAPAAPDLAVFDFDGTLTTRDSFMEFLAWERPGLGFDADLLATLPLLVLYAGRLVGNDAHKMAMFKRRFAGTGVGDFKELSRGFSLERIPRILRAVAIDRLLWHKELGHRVVIISASVADWIEPWASTLGVDKVIASRAEVREDHLTGNLDGPNCYGAEKLRRLMALFPDRTAYQLHAYGDSRGDKALLDAADHSYYRRFA